jgi:sulfhydrogenase subunit delta
MKPKVAFFDFTGCEGCQFEVLNFGPEFLDLVKHVDIVNFREASSERNDDYDIAFIEGSITRPSEIPRLQKIRSQAKALVALGACACIGGINSLKNHMPMTDVLKTVYGPDSKYYDTIPASPINAFVPVEYFVRGCPIDRNEYLKVVKSILLGKRPEIPNYPVCVECKQAENVCVYEKGKHCLGPVTRGGCKAICVSNGRFCWGCRGLIDEPNIYSEIELLLKQGLTLAQALDRFRIFNASAEVLR